MIDLPAPPDLAQLIDAHIAASMGSDWEPWGATWIPIREWPGWKARNGYCNGTTYHHRGVRLFSALGSVKHGGWPRDARPERIAR